MTNKSRARMFLVLVSVILCLIVKALRCDDLTTGEAEEQYKGYSLLRLSKLSNMNEVDAVLNLREKYEEDGDEKRKLIIFDDVILPKLPSIRLLTSPELRPLVERHLQSNDIKYEIVLEDISRSLISDREKNSRQKFRFYSVIENRKLDFAPNHYMNYREVQSLLTNWSNAGDNNNLVETFSIGKTYEGRDTIGISINGDRSDLPAIWLDAGIDPACWLSPASALFVAFQIIHSELESAVKLRSKYRWYFVPVVNPDGYEYSFVADRFWRKTRKPYETQNKTCTGADLNKNFDAYWGGSGTTGDPCTARFRGPEPFSEVEAKNLKNALEERVASEGSLLAYISVQRYGQFIFSPYAGKMMLKPVDYDYLFHVGKLGLAASNTVQEIQEDFRFGTPPDLRYTVRGAIVDWVKDVLKVNWTYVIDVMPTSESVQFPLGYVVPATMVHASGKQTYDIIAAMVDEMRSDLELDLLYLYHGIRSDQAKADDIREEL